VIVDDHRRLADLLAAVLFDGAGATANNGNGPDRASTIS
jgi:hypothetical protein